MNKIEQTVWDLAQPLVEQAGLTLWDVEFVKEGADWFLRVTVDRDEGVSIDQCETVSRALDKLLDKADPIRQSYILEVASAGLERQLKRPGDFEKFMGRRVEVTFYRAIDAAKSALGRLTGYRDGDVELDGGQKTFSAKDIAQVRLRLEE